MKLYSNKCLKCGYYLGIIKCVVSPCPNCSGNNPPFSDPLIKSDTLPNNLLLNKVLEKLKKTKK